MTSLAVVSDVRADQSDTTSNPFASVWRDTDDATLLGFLTRASETVESMIGTRILPFATSEDVSISVDNASWYGAMGMCWVSGSPTRRPELWSGSLTSLSVLDPYNPTPTFTAVSLATVDYSVSDGLIRFPLTASGGQFFYSRSALYPRTARVSYTGGYATIPSDLTEAAILLAADSFLVETDARNNQPDAGDLYSRAMSRINNWTRSHSAGIG